MKIYPCFLLRMNNYRKFATTNIIFFGTSEAILRFGAGADCRTCKDPTAVSDVAKALKSETEKNLKELFGGE